MHRDHRQEGTWEFHNRKTYNAVGVLRTKFNFCLVDEVLHVLRTSSHTILRSAPPGRVKQPGAPFFMLSHPHAITCGFVLIDCIETAWSLTFSILLGYYLLSLFFFFFFSSSSYNHETIRFLVNGDRPPHRRVEVVDFWVLHLLIPRIRLLR